MEIRMKRRISAWLLLLVFVPMMIAAALHVHADEGAAIAECEQCLHHVHHGGHLNAYADHVVECVLCQFAALPFVVATTVALAIALSIHHVAYAYMAKGKGIGVCGVISTRAPPALF